MPVSRSGKHKKKRKGPDGCLSPVSAMGPEHQLECCAINRNWHDAHMAYIVVVRKVAGGFTAAVFLIDTWGVGLKDGFAHKGLDRIALDQLLAHAAGADELIDCPLTLAQELVYGGLAWARLHGFRTPAEAIRCLKILPAPPGEPDFSYFGGKNRKPSLLGSLSTVKKWLAPMIGSALKD